MRNNTYPVLSTLQVAGETYNYFDITKLPNQSQVQQLPFCLKILLENLLRNQDGENILAADIKQLSTRSAPLQQISFSPARVVLQDFTGVPAIVDLASMRDAVVNLGGDPKHINPIVPVDLVIDHSVMVDAFGSDDALRINTAKEAERNRERYQFLRWGQTAFENFRVVPPGRGIVHQVNLEYLASVVATQTMNGDQLLIPDTLVGTDSHTTMINGLGVLGWGVGGIEAEAAMLGQPISMVVPQVVGFELTGTLPPGATATDLVLRVTEMLRAKGVVGKFVEFYGDGLSSLPLADRATIANMAPEYGATCGIFPIDQEVLNYLALSGRSADQIAKVEAYAKAQTLWREDGQPPAQYDEIIALDMSSVVPSIAGPKRPQDRIALADAAASFNLHLNTSQEPTGNTAAERFADEGGHTAIGTEPPQGAVEVHHQDESFWLKHGDVVIAAITSCTNTSNPAVMLAAGLLAANANRKGLRVQPWVKTSLAPGSQVVTAYLEQAGVMGDLNALGFDVVGYGCTTCIGNSGPLPEPISKAVQDADLTVCSVLSGNRNFEGRIHADVKANYLASPPLVVAYALAGTMTKDLMTEPLGYSPQNEPVFLQDIWPSPQEIADAMSKTLKAELYQSLYRDVFEGREDWQNLDVPEGEIYAWPESTYIKKPPYFDGMQAEIDKPAPVVNAHCLVKLGDSITTDHISPAGAIHPQSPAGKYLAEQGVAPESFNSLGSRRGNHEVMIRGTFANPRLKNQLVPESEGSVTSHFPTGQTLSIYDAAMRYQKEDKDLIVLAGKEYGTGSSRDWAAKGVNLLGVKVVIAESFERIHRSNLVGCGVLPLSFKPGQNAQVLGLKGDETYSFSRFCSRPNSITVTATRRDASAIIFETDVQIATPKEWDYFYHGGILPYVLRSLNDTAHREQGEKAPQLQHETEEEPV
ncbi:aconitate hydratase AcnA [Teredinibacter turnerae]|uniref:aconitate hydratase AcnA n=1 Tax=Teredinibacter turnerae TaxID=2426 RepID=UPI0003688B73|nr:aconitate hydratase AcnA [Teredinibacter turnerae]